MEILRPSGLLVAQKLSWLNITQKKTNIKRLSSWLVVQWSYNVFWLFNECCNGFSMFYGQSGSLNHCRNFDPDVSTAKASIRWRCLFPTPTTFAVKQRRVHLAPERIEFDGCGVHWTPTARRTGLANTFAEHVKLRSSNLESINNGRCFQILKNIAQSWHITKRYKKKHKLRGHVETFSSGRKNHKTH